MPRQAPGRVGRKALWSLAKAGAKWFAVFAAALVVGGFLFAWSGLYSVAASRGHWAGFSLMLEFGMRSSVRTHALGIVVPNLDDPAMAERGAGHFQGGCAPCHGAPGRPSSPIVRAMLPEPPDLGLAVPTWKANELFWIVKNGFKYTGMPQWIAKERDDEVWAMVAFLQRLPYIDASQYRKMAGLELRETIPARALAQGGPVGTALAACSRCHGLDGRARANGAFPRLDIQNPDYLFQQLQNYREGTRASGIMVPVTGELDEPDMRRLADYYAAQRTTGISVPAASPDATLKLGHTLATAGIPHLGLPPCLSCHAEDPASRSPLHPALVGQYASYTAQQLSLFKSGKRRDTAAAEIMSVIAERLTREQIDAVSVYLAGVPKRPAGSAN